MIVEDLLRHTAGMIHGVGKAKVDQLYHEHLYDKAGVFHRDRTLADVVSELAKLPLAHQPGEVWDYGHSVDVLGRVIEVVSGQPLDQFLASRLFKPLGMIDTGFYVPEAKLSRLVDPPADNWIGPPDSVLGDVTKPTKLFSGGGGLVSTAADYLRFCQMLLNGGEFDGVRIHSPATIRRMTTNALPSDIRFAGYASGGVGPKAGSTWGLGLAVRSDAAWSLVPGSVSSFNWMGASGTYFWVDPAEQLAADDPCVGWERSFSASASQSHIWSFPHSRSGRAGRRGGRFENRRGCACRLRRNIQVRIVQRARQARVP